MHDSIYWIYNKPNQSFTSFLLPVLPCKSIVMRRFAGIFWMLVLWFCATQRMVAQGNAEVPASSNPQQYILLLKDKFPPKPETILYSPRAAKRRLLQGISTDSLDWPVHQDYLKQVARISGVRVHAVSRWMNALLLQVRDSAALAALRTQSFVAGLQEFGPVRQPAAASDSAFEPAPEPFAIPEPETLQLLRTQPLLQLAARGYGLSHEALRAMNGIRLHDLGYRGKGVLIAVLDAGFSGVDRIAAFDSLNNNKRILATHDFVRGNDWVYSFSDHGTKVLGCLAADIPNVLKGSAPEASYLLLRSEDADAEYPEEMFHWLVAAEFADSMGADIISSSLGYTTFDVPFYEDERLMLLDGTSSLVSRAARWAASRGMLVLNAAGNEGDGLWERISAPADAPEILSVGAVDEQRNSASFSGKGPAAEGRLKPEVAAPGVNIPLVQGNGNLTEGSGTSYATPLLSGLAACLWQAAPRLDAQTLREVMMNSAHRGDFTDVQQGHGIPDVFAAACQLGVNPYFRSEATQILSDIPEMTTQDHLYLRIYAGVAGTARYALFSRGNNRKPAGSGSISLEAQKTAVFRVAPLEHPGPYILQISGPGGFNRMYHIHKIITKQNR
jgi:subtilisin family serine protease